MRRHFVETRYRLPMRRMVWLGCLWMWVLGATMSLVWLLAPAVDDVDLALSGGVMLLSLLCMGLAKTRKWAWAVSCFVWGNWLLSLLWAWHTGGLYGPAVMAFPAWLVVAVWVQGTRAALAMLGLSTLVVAALWWLAPQIGMPAAALSATEHLLALIHVVGMMMLVLIICLQARASLGRRVQKSMETLAALEASQNEPAQVLPGGRAEPGEHRHHRSPVEGRVCQRGLSEPLGLCARTGPRPVDRAWSPPWAWTAVIVSARSSNWPRARCGAAR